MQIERERERKREGGRTEELGKVQALSQTNVRQCNLGSSLKLLIAMLLTAAGPNSGTRPAS